MYCRYVMRIWLCAMSYGVLALTSLPSCAAECGQQYPKRWRESEVLHLDAQTTGPAFYARRDQFVLFFNPEVVVATLAKIASEHDYSENRKFLELTKNKLPLTTNLDVYGFAVTSQVSISSVDMVVARLIEGGHGKLMDLKSPDKTLDPALQSITKVTIIPKKSPPTEFLFCAPDGELLLSIVDLMT
jgi:hypothetical protein